MAKVMLWANISVLLKYDRVINVINKGQLWSTF